MAPGSGESLFSANWLVHRLHRRHVEVAVREYARGALLDVGCGQRPLLDVLERHAQACVGVEPDRSRYAHGPLPEAWGSALCLPFQDGTFDTVVAFQVLEHVPEPGRMMAEVARVLRPGAHLILTAPHMWGIHEEPEDYYRFTPYGLSHLADAAGMRVVRVIPLAGYWVTAGARLCHYLAHFEKIGLVFLTRPLFALVQLMALGLDRLHRVEGDAWNHLLVARRPPADLASDETRA